MKKIVFFLFLVNCCIGVTTASAQSMGQSYQTALGLKVAPTAITVKHFLREDRAVEGLVYLWRYGTRVTGLYEFHWDINALPGLKWYVGPGAHIGFWNNNWERSYPGYNSGAYFGLDGVLGLDYKIENAPINVSVDWQPSFNFGSGPENYYGFYSGFGGIAVRYTF